MVKQCLGPGAEQSVSPALRPGARPFSQWQGSAKLPVHLDGVPAVLPEAEIIPVEPDPVYTGVGIEMRACRRPALVRAACRFGSLRTIDAVEHNNESHAV